MIDGLEDRHTINGFLRLMKSLSFKFSHFVLFLSCSITFISCDPDLEEVNRIASIQAEEPVDISKNVKVIFSDSARVKAELTAPEMRSYQMVENPYYEFPSGIKIVFFDSDGNYQQEITSDYAIRKEKEELVEFRNNVQILRADGFLIKTEELIHNENLNTFYNNSLITGTSKDGKNSFQGSSFSANGDFTDIIIQNTIGTAIIPEDRSMNN